MTKRRRELIKGQITHRFVFIAVSIWVIIIVALGTGLGISLREKNGSPDGPGSSTKSPTATSEADYRIGGRVDDRYYSDKGAWSGSGIALSSQSFPESVEDAPRGSLVMYFQHHAGGWDVV